MENTLLLSGIFIQKLFLSIYFLLNFPPPPPSRLPGGSRLLPGWREKKAQKISPPAAGETPDPAHATPRLAGGRRRRHGHLGSAIALGVHLSVHCVSFEYTFLLLLYFTPAVS